VKKSGGKIIENKGATFFAVAMAVCHICKCLLSDAGTALTVSTMMHGEYGVSDVCLSTLNIVGKEGAVAKVMIPLNDTELAALHRSADTLKAVIKDLKI